jgi:hypothetical protein
MLMEISSNSNGPMDIIYKTDHAHMQFENVLILSSSGLFLTGLPGEGQIPNA